MKRFFAVCLVAIILGIFVSPLFAQDPSPADINRIAKIVGKGRYMESPQCQTGESPATHRCCQSVAADDPLMSSVLAPYKDYREPRNGHLGLADCRYLDSGLETRVIMLNPKREQVAVWTISACRAANAASLDNCATWAWKKIFSNSGTQFAVTGAVIEENQERQCRSDGEPQPDIVGYTFRDGVTVRLRNVKGVCDGDADRLKAEPSLYFSDDVVQTTVRGPSRITMMTRQRYFEFFGGDLPGQRKDADGVIPWLKLVREAHMNALGSTSHPWLDKLIAADLPIDARLP